jgi:replication factor C large subunit
VEWTEKYRPRRLDDLVGNKKALQSLLSWARSWDAGKTPKKRAVILAGKPGCGKTSAAHALASDMGWGVIELNASDTRNADAIRRVATAGALNQTFTDEGDFLRADSGGRKLIILDEADHIHGTVDRGGIKTILETIRKTFQPIILIVNDLYQLTRHSSAFKTLAMTIRFQAVPARSIKPVLKRIAAAEHIEVDDLAIESISERTAGDLRSSINDLQALSEGRNYIGPEDVDAVGKRDTKVTMYDAVRTILKSDNVRAARRAASEVDEEPEFLLLWLSENVPNEYKDLEDLARGMEAIARADLFLNRARRTQNYRLWAYASDLMSAGVATAKDREYRFYTQYRFPLWLATMGRTRAMRQTKASLSRKLRKHCHTSDAIARDELIPFYRMMFDLDGAFAVEQTGKLDLGEAELAMLLGDTRDGKRVQMLMEAVEQREASGHIDPAGLGFSVFERKPDDDDDDDDVDDRDEDDDDDDRDDDDRDDDDRDDDDRDDSDDDDDDRQKRLFEF